MQLTQELEQYLLDCQEELKTLIRDLCAIPAPSHHEQRRAEFCKHWFDHNGFEGAYIDEALNAVCPYGVTPDGPLMVFMAHTDTVFPDMEPMPFREENGKYYCPGVCDDTANLAVFLLCARYFVQKGCKPACGMLFVANSCEEGLGNLKGSRKIVDTFGDRMVALVTFDGWFLNEIVNRAVGSTRYCVTVKTEGGHSFGAFGNRNAIHSLSEIICDLYAIALPKEGDSKTTYNVGVIEGGTSVNTIAQEAHMLYEYRSDNRACLAAMENNFHAVIESHRRRGIHIEVEMIGERPCAGDVDMQKQAQLDRAVADAVRTILQKEPVFKSGSTDCNYSLSKGIPSICVSACEGRYAHKREEELDLDSLPIACRIVAHFLCNYFD